VTPRRGVFWPLVLIALGLVFLLSNYGFVTISWLAILSLWPLLLVLIGLDIAFARRWPLQTLIAEVLVIAGGLALVATSPTVGGVVFFSGGNGGGGVTDVSAPRGNATSVSVALSGGAGRYHVTSGATALLDAHSANPDLRLRTSGSSDHPDLRIDQVGPEGFFRVTSGIDINVQLASDVPTSFTMNLGAGEFDVDLSDVRITDARVNTGASTLRLTLPKPTGDVAVRVSAGASQIILTVPDGVDARVTTTGGLLSLRSDNPGLGEGGGTGGCVACGTSVQTTGYASAHDRVTVTISAGASSITVR
jgi:cell wall-active antibiotic response 4TMS protein YvqF